MFCPKCRYEYGKDISFCPDCRAELVETLPEEPTPRAMEPVWLIYAKTTVEARMMRSLLDDNGIKCVGMEREAGGMMKLYMGGSVYGEDIYVDSADLEKAQELIEFLYAPPDFEALAEMENEAAAAERENGESRRPPFHVDPGKAMRATVYIVYGLIALAYILSRFIN